MNGGCWTWCPPGCKNRKPKDSPMKTEPIRFVLSAMFCLVFTAMPVRAASDTVAGVEWTYDIVGGTATVTEANPSEGELSIPAELGGCPVTRIGEYAFSWSTNLTSVAIPDSVIEIGKGAFFMCKKLSSTGIPEHVQYIGEAAFRGCRKLTDLAIPNSVIGIGPEAFYDTGLKTLAFGNHVEVIGEEAFSCCSDLVSVAIPAGVKRIEPRTFWACMALKTISIPTGVTDIGDYAFAECYSLTNAPLPNSVTNIGTHAFAGCGFRKTLSIPDGVTSIGDYAYTGCNSLRSVVLPSSLVNLGRSVFGAGVFSEFSERGCTNLASIQLADPTTSSFATTNGALLSRNGKTLLCCPGKTEGTYEIPASVTSIGEGALSGCSRLTTVAIPVGVTRIGAAAFRDCSRLETVGIPDSVTNIEDETFYGCSRLGTVVIPYGVTSIGSYAFSESGLTNLVIPDSVTSIGNGAFAQNGLTNLVVPVSVTNIAEGAFAYSNLGSLQLDADNPAYVLEDDMLFTRDMKTLLWCSTKKTGNFTLPEGLTRIGGEAFEDCQMSRLVFPESLESIGSGAFINCEHLVSVTIPAGVTNIEYASFDNCGQYYIPAGTRIYVHADNPVYASRDGVLFTKDMTGLLWARTSNKYVVPDGVEAIADRAFDNCYRDLQEVTFPASVTHLGESPFAFCQSLVRIRVPVSWRKLDLLKNADLPWSCIVVFYEPEEPANEATQTTPVAVPHSWLHEQAPTILAANGNDYEAAALSEAENGRPVWECYLVGVSPETGQDFKATVEWQGGEMQVKPDPDLGADRSYTVEGAESILGEQVWGEPTDSSLYFRIKVGMSAE